VHDSHFKSPTGSALSQLHALIKSGEVMTLAPPGSGASTLIPVREFKDINEMMIANDMMIANNNVTLRIVIPFRFLL
jgi:hypothetical protein